jgi:nicotinamidase-related amidase
VLSAFPALVSQRHGADTVLTGLLDRSALYGVLAEIDALGLDLIEVRHLTADANHQDQVTAAHRDDHYRRAHPNLLREGEAPMTSAPVRDPLADHLITPQNAALLLIDYQPAQLAGVRSMDRALLVMNAVSTVSTIKTFEVPVVHSTINVATGRGQPTLPELADLLTDDKPLDRTTTNSWEDIEFVQAVHATGRRKLIICALWTEICMAFTALDALREGYEVYPVVDAIGGTSPEAHRAGLDRVIQAGGQPISWVSLAVELQRDWARQDTVAAVVEIVLTDRLLKEQ